MTVDGESHDFAGYSVAVANSGVYGSGMYLVPDASLDDGVLDVVLCEHTPKRTLPGERPEGVQGHPRRRARASPSCAGARSASAPTGRSTAYADGDPIADLPATVRILPGTLRVLAP